MVAHRRRRAPRRSRTMINSLGTNFIMIMPGASTQGGARIFTGQSTLTGTTPRRSARVPVGRLRLAAACALRGQVVAGELNWGTQVYGVDVDWPFIRAWNVDDGASSPRPTSARARRSRSSARPSPTTCSRRRRASARPSASRTCRSGSSACSRRKGGSMMGSDQDDMIVAPYTTVHEAPQGRQRIGMIIASADVGRAGAATRMDEIDALLRQRHRIPPGGDADFMHALAGGDRRRRQQARSRTLQPAARRSPAISLARRRHRHHEHHAGLGDRADARDRHPHGHRRQGPARAGAVPARGGGAVVVGGGLGIGFGLLASRLMARFTGWPIAVSPPRWRSHSASPRRSGSSSASIPRARPRASIRSRRCVTSEPRAYFSTSPPGAYHETTSSGSLTSVNVPRCSRSRRCVGSGARPRASRRRTAGSMAPRSARR